MTESTAARQAPALDGTGIDFDIAAAIDASVTCPAKQELLLRWQQCRTLAKIQQTLMVIAERLQNAQ